MKRFWCAIFSFAVVFALLQPVCAQIQGQWVSTGTMQSTRELHALVAGGGRALTMGGVDGSGNVLASAEVYSSSPAIGHSPAAWLSRWNRFPPSS
jgi:hypothetical protein